MRITRLLGALLVVAGTAGAQELTQSAPGAVLRALDKFNGRVLDLDVRSNSTVQFQRLNITLTECRYPSGNPSGNAYAGLEISETGRSGVIFSGWMVASSPALNAMDHARYDVWVLRCTTS